MPVVGTSRINWNGGSASVIILWATGDETSWRCRCIVGWGIFVCVSFIFTATAVGAISSILCDEGSGMVGADLGNLRSVLLEP